MDEVDEDSTGSAARWDFFISYTAADRTWAEWIAWHLEVAGYTVLVQAWDFVPGSHWMSHMDEGIRSSARTLAVLSRAYLRSVYGQAEWEGAYRADPTGFARRLIPVRVEDCPRPGLLGGVVSFDLFGLVADEARQRLLTQIAVIRRGRAKPVAEPPFPGPASAADPPQARRPPGERQARQVPVPGTVEAATRNQALIPLDPTFGSPTNS